MTRSRVKSLSVVPAYRSDLGLCRYVVSIVARVSDDRWPVPPGGLVEHGAEPIDITPGRPETPTPYPRRRLHIALLVSAAVGAVVTGAAGYAVLAEPAAVSAVPAPTLSVSVPPPADLGLPPARAAEPVTAAPPREAKKDQKGQKEKRDKKVKAADARLAAHLTGSGRLGEDGRPGWLGTVTITNPGPRPARQWRVTMTVPGGAPVYAGPDVVVDQRGERVTVRAGAAAPAGGRLYLWVAVAGRVPGGPVDCLVDGHPCTGSGRVPRGEG